LLTWNHGLTAAFHQQIISVTICGINNERHCVMFEWHEFRRDTFNSQQLHRSLAAAATSTSSLLCALTVVYFIYLLFLWLSCTVVSILRSSQHYVKFLLKFIVIFLTFVTHITFNTKLIWNINHGFGCLTYKISAFQTFDFSTLSLLAGHQEEQPACKILSGKVLEWGADDLHMVQRMSLPPHHLLLQ